MKIINTQLVQIVLQYRRKLRVKYILKKMKLPNKASIIDVGCGPTGKSFEDFANKEYNILGIDLLSSDKIKTKHPGFSYLKKDASDLTCFADKEFDLAISIGMMEHICDEELLEKMANGIKRIAKESIIIVPWKYAIIEPHFKFPFFPLLPYPIKVFLTKLLNLHGLRKWVKNDYNHIRKRYQWFSNSKWKLIFGGTNVYVLPFGDTIAIVKMNQNLTSN